VRERSDHEDLQPQKFRFPGTPIPQARREVRAVSPLSDGKSPAPKSKATPSVRLSSQPVSEHHLNHVDSFRYRGYHACNQYLDGLWVALSEVQSVPYRLILIYTPKYSSGLIGPALVCIDGSFGGDMLLKKGHQCKDRIITTDL
jgi:hypothetical protein